MLRVLNSLARLIPWLPFFFLFPSECRSFSALLPRVTTAMAGALCGQRLPVVVKAQTISRSDRPLFQLLLFLSSTHCAAQRERVSGVGRRKEQKLEINGREES